MAAAREKPAPPPEPGNKIRKQHSFIVACPSSFQRPRPADSAGRQWLDIRPLDVAVVPE